MKKLGNKLRHARLHKEGRRNGNIGDPAPPVEVSRPPEINPGPNLPIAMKKRWPGSGPTPGVLGLEPGSTSSKAINNYFPKNGEIEYVFDHKKNIFAVGKPTANLGGSGHEQLAKSINADPDSVAGGIFRRTPDGKIATDEQSGHFWKNWTPEKRKQFENAMKSHDLDHIHSRGGGQ